MENISATHNEQIFLALQAAAFVIRKMDKALTSEGKGLDLSKVPAFYGVDFPSFLNEMGGMIPLEEKTKETWKRFYACNE